ncbi:MAG: hypothetical protein N2050_10985 [Flavobacteriales bacterium]|nr:hypothetical protein [Flavobacteriales bacterium]
MKTMPWYSSHFAMKGLLAAAVIALASCRTQHAWIRFDQASDFEVYQPARRQAWPFSRSMPYDRDFKVSKIFRSWTTAYQFPFVVVFSGAKEKFRFEISGRIPEATDSFHAKVFCTARIREKDFPLFFVGIPPLVYNVMPPDKYENFFFGKVYSSDSLKFGHSFFAIGEPPFILMPRQMSEGYLMLDTTKFAIVGVNSVANLKGDRPVFTGHIVGFEVYDAHKEKLVMGVSAVNEGRVWLRKNLTTKEKNHLMALASALLLRRDLKEIHQNVKSGFQP